MQSQHGLAGEVNRHQQRILEGVHDIAEDVTLAAEIHAIMELGVQPACRQMHQMKDNEQDQEAAGQRHGAGGQGGPTIVMDHVTGRTRAPVLNRQADRQTDMQADDGEQRDARTPEGHGHVAQECGIRIQGVLPLEYLQVSEHVKDDESGQSQSRKGNEDLAAEGGENVTEESNHGQRIKSRRFLHLYSARFHSSSVCGKRDHETDAAAAQPAKWPVAQAH